jgi:hypothetical protein
MSNTSASTQTSRQLLSRHFMVAIVGVILTSCCMIAGATMLPSFHHADSTLLLHDYDHGNCSQIRYSLMKNQLNEFAMIRKVSMENHVNQLNDAIKAVRDFQARQELEERTHKQTIHTNMTHDELNEWLKIYMVEEEKETMLRMESLYLKDWPEFAIIERPERNLQCSRRLMPSWADRRDNARRATWSNQGKRRNTIRYSKAVM